MQGPVRPPCCAINLACWVTQKMQAGAPLKYKLLYMLLLCLAQTLAQAQTCSMSTHGARMNSTLDKLAQSTGGTVTYLSRKEASNPDLAKIAGKHYSSQGDISYLAKVSSALSPVAIPVERSLDEVSFRVTVAGDLAITLVDPAGKPVTADYPDSHIATLPSACLVTIKKPTPGLWQLQTEGSGSLTLNAFADSPVWLEHINFIEEALGHEGPMERPVPRKIDETQHAEIKVVIDANIKSVDRFEVRNAQGQVLHTIAIRKCNPSELGSRVTSMFGALGLSSAAKAACKRGEAPLGHIQIEQDYWLDRFPAHAQGYFYVIGTDIENHMFSREIAF